LRAARRRRPPDEQQLARPDAHPVARRQLAAAALLGLLVDQDALLGQQPLGLRAAVDDPGELEQLAQPDARPRIAISSATSGI